MKKVLVFGITDNPGGVESVIMNYYRNIDKDKIQFDFLCNTDIVAYEDEIIKLGGKVYRITARSKNRKEYKIQMKDFFQSHAKEYTSIWVNVCSLANIDYLKYAKKYGIKYRIIHSHNSQNMDSLLRGLMHRWNRLFIKKYATDFWSCSDDASKWFYSKKIINSDKFLLVKNAINYDTFKFNEVIRNEYRKKLDIEDKFVIGNVGRIHFQKNHPFIIKVFSEIHKMKKNSVLLLVGDGVEKEKIKEMVKQYNLEKNVLFLGIRKDTPQLLNAMDVFLFPSLFEGLPLALVEAQTSNLLIYASKGRINKDIVINEDNFNFLSIEDSEKIWAEKIVSDFKKNSNDRNKDILNLLQTSGYDINQEKEKIQKIFERE